MQNNDCSFLIQGNFSLRAQKKDIYLKVKKYALESINDDLK